MDISNADVRVTQEHKVAADKDNIHMIKLDIHVKPTSKGSFPYNIAMVIAGFFEVEQSFDEKDKGLLAHVNGSSILYGAAREYIFTATAHGKFGPLMLPATSFNKKSQKTKSIQNVTSLTESEPLPSTPTT